MNPITCGMAADLLPLYLDGCCSADSRAALEAHMDACPACRAQYAQLRRDLTPAAPAAEDPGTAGIARALARNMRRRKRCLRALCAVLGVLLLLVGVGIRYSVLPEIDTDSQNSASGADDTPGRRSLFDFPYLWLGALAIFCQVGAQVVAIDTIINYAGSMGMDLVESKVFPSFTLTCTMIGFLSGIVLIPRYVTQKQALVVCSTLGLLLSLGVVLCDFGVTLFGHRANASIFLLNALGLPNALIYAGVWPLAIRGLGRFTKMGSSLLIMGLCGNAILPLVYGFVAERCGMRMGYWVLVPCFLYLVFFAVKGYKIVRWPWQRIENNG
mgnify:CR=1 FL=1